MFHQVGAVGFVAALQYGKRQRFSSNDCERQMYQRVRTADQT